MNILAQKIKMAFQKKLFSDLKAYKLAIVIHAYYDELLVEILQFLKQLHDIQFKIYITTPNPKSARLTLERSGLPYYLEKTENHGRDILPFLQIMQQVKQDGYEFIIKVHTKKSPHRTDGNIWRQDLYNKLLTRSKIKRNISLFQKESTLGILAPEGYLLPINNYIGDNIDQLRYLSHRLGINFQQLLQLKFVAGSMFMAKVVALEPLLALDLGIDDFEVETGQLDGTMAHAIERVIAVSAYSIGLEVKNSNSKLRAKRNYQFT